MAVRSSNIVAARGANTRSRPCNSSLLTILKLLLMLSELPWALEAWTR